MLLEYIFNSDSQKDLIPTGILVQRLGLKPDLTGMGGRYKIETSKICFICSFCVLALEKLFNSLMF